MKPLPHIPLIALATAFALPAAAATWTGATNGSWATGGNWSGTPPDNTTAQPIVFDSTSNANLTQTLDGSYTLTGITLTNPTGAVTVNKGTGTNTLTIGSGGIDMSSAAQNLILGSTTSGSGFNVVVGATQSWNVGAGRTLTVGQQAGTITLNANLTKTGAGSFSLGGSGATTLTGSGILEIDGGTFTNNMQSGSSASGRSGATTLTSGNLVISTSISMFGSGSLNLNGGAIGSGTSTSRSIGNSLTIGGNVSFGGTGFSTGQLTFSGDVNLQGTTRTLTSALGVQGARFNGLVSNGGITMEGSGRITLANDGNTFTGGTTINGGILATSLGALATSSSVTIANGASLALGSNGTTTINNLSGVTGSTIRSDFNIGTDGSRTIEINQSTSSVFAGTFTQGTNRQISLIKKGDATLTLSGNATGYTGTTTVSAGTLRVNGSLGATTTTVESGATLDGTGSVSGPVSILSGGTIAPGNGISGFTVANLSMAAGSTFAFEALNDSATGADLLVTSTLSLTGVTLGLSGADLAGVAWTMGDKLTLISYTGSAISSGFTGYNDNTSYFFGANEWLFRYADTTPGNNFAAQASGSRFVTLTVVPEPSAALLGGLGLLRLLRRKRA